MMNETYSRLNDIFHGLNDLSMAGAIFPFNEYMFSSLKSVIITLVLYLAVIFGIQRIMRNRKPMRIDMISFVHNIFLSLGSTALLILIAMKLEPALFGEGLHYAVCSYDMFNRDLAFLYYINYLFKFYELLDTVILALKKKPLSFLHVYHHCLTLILCYTQIVGECSVQWVPIVANLFVHAFMYWYFAMTCLKINVWWKKYLTGLQIAQFIIDVGFCCYALGVYELNQANLVEKTCNGSRAAGIFGIGLLFSYLLLFVDFYKKSYTPTTKNGPKNTK